MLRSAEPTRKSLAERRRVKARVGPRRATRFHDRPGRHRLRPEVLEQEHVPAAVTERSEKAWRPARDERPEPPVNAFLSIDDPSHPARLGHGVARLEERALAVRERQAEGGRGRVAPIRANGAGYPYAELCLDRRPQVARHRCPDRLLLDSTSWHIVSLRPPRNGGPTQRGERWLLTEPRRTWDFGKDRRILIVPLDRRLAS